MTTQRTVSDPQENIKVIDLKSKPWSYLPLVETKRLIKCEEKFKEFVLRQLPTFNLTTIEWILECKPTEVDDIKHDLILTRIYGRLVMASVHDESESTLLSEDLKVKRVIDKLYKETLL